VERRQLRHTVGEVAFTDDRTPSVDRFRLVAVAPVAAGSAGS
jgi:hypothetical protein